MAHRKNKKSRPAKEPQPPPINPLLGPNEQGTRYRVCAFALQPEIEFLTAPGEDGKVKVKLRKRAASALAVFEDDFDKTVREIMQESKLKMESHPKP